MRNFQAYISEGVYDPNIFKEGERLIQKDGTIYEGKLHKGPNGCRYTDDGRWFDKSGMPIDK